MLARSKSFLSWQKEKEKKSLQYLSGFKHDGSQSNLKFSGHYVTHRVAHVLKDVFRSNKNVKMAELAYCCISDESLEIICQGLRWNTTLTELDLAGNTLEHNGFSALVEVISSDGCGLTKLAVYPDWERADVISASVAESIAELIRSKSQLVKLDLGLMRLDFTALPIIARAMASNTKIQKLVIDGGERGDIIDALTTRNRLCNRLLPALPMPTDRLVELLAAAMSQVNEHALNKISSKIVLDLAFVLDQLNQPYTTRLEDASQYLQALRFAIICLRKPESQHAYIQQLLAKHRSEREQTDGWTRGCSVLDHMSDLVKAERKLKHFETCLHLIERLEQPVQIYQQGCTESWQHAGLTDLEVTTVLSPDSNTSAAKLLNILVRGLGVQLDIVQQMQDGLPRVAIFLKELQTILPSLTEMLAKEEDKLLSHAHAIAIKRKDTFKSSLIAKYWNEFSSLQGVHQRLHGTIAAIPSFCLEDAAPSSAPHQPPSSPSSPSSSSSSSPPSPSPSSSSLSPSKRLPLFAVEEPTTKRVREA